MKLHNNPPPYRWQKICRRPTIDSTRLEVTVQPILEDVKKRGDAAVLEYTEKFDGVRPEPYVQENLQLQERQFDLPENLKEAIRTAERNIRTFHAEQNQSTPRVETTRGITCWRDSRPIERVGLYIPGGTAPLISTVLMLGVPAQVARCNEIILCSPPNNEGKIPEAILYAAHRIGASRIVAAGGAQAIAAMAFGTDKIPQCYKLFGPGNQYVTAAKQLVNKMGTAIDLPAGPSELLVVTDESSNPAFVAADLLSQAEHGEDSSVMLVGTDESILQQTMEAVQTQVKHLPRRSIAEKALANSSAVLLKDLKAAMQFSNRYAPEHLILATDNAYALAREVQTAGSVFVGSYSAEAVGDYASGTNHTLPTNGYARMYSGVSLDSFQKKITFQEVSPEGLRNIQETVTTLARAEQLDAHARAVEIRTEALAPRKKKQAS